VAAALAAWLGPFRDADSISGIATGMTLVAGMAFLPPLRRARALFATERAGGSTTLDLNVRWRFPDFGPGIMKPEIKINMFNLTDKRALTFDSATTVLAEKGPLDPHTGAALYAAGAYYNLLEPRSYMLTVSASLY
jgi:outer membrane receptor protein involved in Fe transport